MANTKKKEHYFEVLRKHNVSEYMEKKGQFNYLSWAYAVEELRKLKPDATWRVIKTEEGYPYISTPAGHFVEVEVTVDGMYLYFYNKDTSKTKTTEVPMIEKSKAYMYWEAINEEHAKGLPKMELGQSPEKTWACGYCPFRDECKPDAYIEHMKKRGAWF